MKDEYDKTAERIHALDMPMESYQVGTNKIAALLREAFPEHAQAAPSEERVDKALGWFIGADPAYSPESCYGLVLAAEVRRLRAALASERSKRIEDVSILQNVIDGQQNEMANLASERSKREGTYSIEPHGDAWVLYAGRDTEHHGANLCRLSEFDARGEETRAAIVRALNTAPAPDAAALREALRVCGNCKHGQPTSLDDTRCYKATPYLPVDRWAIACAGWEAAPTRNNPRAALLRSEPRGESK